MKKHLILVPVLLIFTSAISAQGKYSTKSARISFYSSSPLENIEATNKSAVALLDGGNGDLQFSLLMKGFEFRKALMQEHFNSKFAESDKYPKATFKGQVINNSAVNYTVNGTYPVTVKGQLTIHGVTKQVEYPAKLVVQQGKISASSTFNVLLADYNITIPKMYRDNISKSIKINVGATLEAL